ncbi:reverse transcriptase domain-containing protein [Tanacetum coccineum]
MTITNQGLSIAEIEQIIAQRVTSAIETITIYETKTRVACESMNQTKRQEDKMVDHASNKRKWEGEHSGSSSQNKGHKVIRAHTIGPSNKKVYAGKIPLCNRCKLHHNGQCTVKCTNCNRIGHMTKDCRAFASVTTQRPPMAKQKTEVTCYECGKLGHYKDECPKWRSQNHVNK